MKQKHPSRSRAAGGWTDPAVQIDRPERKTTTRRRFLQTAVSTVITAPLGFRRARAAVPPNSRLTVGVIGIGAMGKGHLTWCLGHPAVQVIGVCDVDKVRCDAAKRRVDAYYASRREKGTYKACVAYNDYRDLIARDDLDAVVIVTPDHWHTPISVDAAKAGKDIYCEKPVSLTIQEGQRLIEVVRQYGRVFQTGTQYRSMYRTRRVLEFVRAGGLGKIKQVFAVWSKADGSYVPINPALPAEPVPEGLDWNMWVGPAPWHPYNSRYHRNPIPGVVPWAFCEDFGAASVTWHFSHSADVIQWALGAERSGPTEIIHPSSGEFPTLTFRYAHGTLLHLVEHWGQVKSLYGAVPAAARLAGSFGGLFVGERGWVTSMYGRGVRFEGEPEEIFREMRLDSRVVTGANNHHDNWLECIRTRAVTSTDEEIGHRAAALGHLAILAFKLRRSLKWDPAKEEFLNDDEANRLRSRAMREPWRL